MQVEVHDRHLPVDAPDEDWLALVGRNGWVALTRDKQILHRADEIDAVRRHRVRVIVIRLKKATGSELADLLVQYRREIASFVAQTPAPFVARIDRSGSITPYDISKPG